LKSELTLLRFLTLIVLAPSVLPTFEVT